MAPPAARIFCGTTPLTLLLYDRLPRERSRLELAVMVAAGTIMLERRRCCYDAANVNVFATHSLAASPWGAVRLITNGCGTVQIVIIGLLVPTASHAVHFPNTFELPTTALFFQFFVLFFSLCFNCKLI